MKNNGFSVLPGILLSLIIAVIAYLLGRINPVVGGAVIGITLGMVTSLLWKRPKLFDKGVNFTSKYILQFAVILLGFDMSISNVMTVGRQSLWIIIITISSAFITAFLFGRLFHVKPAIQVLVGVGTAICGASAIAAAAPAIHAEDEDVSYSISTIFLFNVLAVFLFPVFGRLLGMSDAGFGMWAGTAINDTSSVVAASYSFSDAAGNFATIVKLTRTLAIIPVTLAIAIGYAYVNRKDNRFRLSKIFPWFIIGFLAAAIIRSLGIISPEIAAKFVWFGKFLIIAAMAAIGLNTNVQKFITTGPRALSLGALTWLSVMITSLGIQLFGNLW